jgi:hypothetical protein
MNEQSDSSRCSPRREPAAFRPHWPKGLDTRTFYEIPCDDDGRLLMATLKVMIAEDGDVHVSMQRFMDDPRNLPQDLKPHETMDPFPSVRIRTLAGGGKNTRTRQALLWLAEAIRLDNIDHPENAIR